MGKIFFSMPCLSSSGTLKCKSLFGKKYNNRYPESSVQRFLGLNKKMFDFLGVDVDVEGSGRDFGLSFHTSNYIGAIPVKMPNDGIVHSDFQVIPRFDTGGDVYSELTNLLSSLEFSIEPEYHETEMLSEAVRLKPPIYYESAKFIERFSQACKAHWMKFDIITRDHPYPKASTNWSRHALTSYDPERMLSFRSRDNILTTNHKEWQQLKYVFELAKAVLFNPKTPSSIRYKYEPFVRSLEKRVCRVKPQSVDHLIIHASDPLKIKGAKEQANVFLQKSGANCAAWRIDIAELFERYVQTIVSNSLKELSGNIFPNSVITGKGDMPKWRLNYLEPDMTIKIKDCVYMADAKYKSHLYNTRSKTESLTETHRADVHQLLAYCSFEPQEKKAGVLFYPSSATTIKRIVYEDRIGGRSNRVILCGIPFRSDAMAEVVNHVTNLFRDDIDSSNNVFM